MGVRRQYVNLHTHGTYSKLDGHGSYENYAKRAAELGQPSLAITEHGNIHGLIEFYEACKKHGVKPIMGTEAYQARKTRFDLDEEELSGRARAEFDQRGPHHLTILAKNYTGYKNLIKLSSRAFLEGWYQKPRTDLELLSDHSEGLIVLSGCLSGQVQQALLADRFDLALEHAKTMQDIFGKDNYFIELHDHGIEEEHIVRQGLLEIAGIIGARLAPSGDCHYVNKEDSFAHDLLLCISTKATIHTEDRFSFVPEEFYLRSYNEMLERFEPEWLENTMLISDMVEDFELDFETNHFPKFQDIRTGKSLHQTFVEEIREGAQRIYGKELPQEVKDRLNHEVGVIQRMGYEEYMLIVADIIRWCSENGIMTGPGRGSAAGCLVAYCLGITKIDPLESKLLFERFLVEGKKSNPDIDLDIDSRYRDRVIQYCKDKYGEDHVANIITFGTIKARSAIRDAARVLGHSFSLGGELANMTLPSEFGKPKSLTESLEGSAELKEAYETDEIAKEILDAALGVEGIVRQDGIHAAGVVIAPGPVMDFAPILRKGENNPVVTQWDGDTIDKIKLLKMDLLGLRTLDVISDALNIIKEQRGEEIDVYSLPLDDEETFKTISNGRTVAVFQLESNGIQGLAKSIGITNMEHLAALESLYRPGPMGSNMHSMYAKRKHGQQATDSYHDMVKPILKDTQGLMIYQEQVMQIVQTLANFSVVEADGLRKAIGKKKKEDLLEFRDRFIEGCKENSIPKTTADKIFSDIEYFGDYSFNRSHAFSYGFLSYITAYLKTHYPTEFMTAALTSVMDDPDKLKVYLNECAEMGISVQTPSVKHSSSQFTVVEDGVISFGLLGIKGIGASLVETILKNQSKIQECETIADWMRLSPGAVDNKKTLEALIYAGALDELGYETEHEVTDDQKMQLLNIERRQLGVYVTDHPMRMYNIKSRPLDFNKNRYVKLTGVLVDLNQRVTKAGATMYEYKIERLEDTIDVVVFPKTAEDIDPEDLQEGTIVTVEGRLMLEYFGDNEEPYIKLIHMGISQEEKAFQYEGINPIVIELHSVPDQMTFKDVYDKIASVKGMTYVYFKIPQDDHDIVIKLDRQTTSGNEHRIRAIVKDYIRKGSN